MAISKVPIQQPSTIVLSLQESIPPQMEAVASNLSNAGTNGFKALMLRSEATFQTSSDRTQVSYVKAGTPTRDFRDGPYKQTDNNLDVALAGEGFFQLENNQLTRNGQFSMNSDGKLINGLGLSVVGDGGDLVIPKEATFVQIAEDGTVSTNRGKIGKILVFSVADPTSLTYGKDGNYTATTEVIPVEKPKVLQGFLEESNVNPMEETIKLIEMVRLFEQAQKFMDDNSKRTSQVINMSAQHAA